MTVEIRLIGSPDEVSEAESLLRDRFVIHSMRHCASRHSDTDRRAYIKASPRQGAPSEVMEVPEDIADLKVRLRDLEDRNNVLLCYSFRPDRYLDFEDAREINRRVNDVLRETVDRDLKDVRGRLDQTYKQTSGSLAIYRSEGGDWMVVPYRREVE